jgi:hypothetical protein
MLSLGRRAEIGSDSGNACNSLHTNKMRRPTRKSSTLNITQSHSPESTMDLLMEKIDFTDKAPLKQGLEARDWG